MSTIRRARQGALALAAMGALLVTTIATGPTTATAAAGPSGLRATEVTTSAVGLTWSKQDENAYRVRMSTNSDMSDPETWDVLGNYYAWTQVDPNPDSISAALKPGTTYYFQVKSIENTASSPDDLSSYSAKVAVKTRSSGYSELAPVDLSATSARTSLHLSWRNGGPGRRYAVRYTKLPAPSDVLSWKKVTFSGPSGTVTGLSANTNYRFRVRVLDSSGSAASEYSSSWERTTAGASDGLKVMSYNVTKLSSSPDTNPWAKRRDILAANIRSQAPAVIGLQEASPLRVSGSLTQYDDLLARLGSRYKLATRAGSSGTKLAYDSTRLSVVNAAAKSLTTLGSATRYAVWAVFKDKLSGKKIFVINTHLEPSSSGTTAECQAIRIKQAKEVLALITAHSAGLPVVLTGDMNESRNYTPKNGPYTAFTSAGLVDPIDNTAANWITGSEASAEHVQSIEYNSYNGFESTARRTRWPVGTHIDYIFTSAKLRVAEHRMVLSLDSAGKFVGTIPSDHNALMVTVLLG